MHARALASAAVVALSVAAFPALAQQTNQPARGVPDATSATAGRVVTQGAEGVRAVTTPRDFIEQATSSDMLEIETGRMAADKGNNEAVRAYGQHLVADHTRTSQQVMALAARHGVAPAGTMEPRHMQIVDALRPLSGSAFDQAFVMGQVEAHREAVALYESAAAATSPDMAEIRAFATQTLPALRQHLQMAQGLAGTGVPTAKQ